MADYFHARWRSPRVAMTWGEMQGVKTGSSSAAQMAKQLQRNMAPVRHAIIGSFVVKPYLIVAIS